MPSPACYVAVGHGEPRTVEIYLAIFQRHSEAFKISVRLLGFEPRTAEVYFRIPRSLECRTNVGVLGFEPRTAEV